MNAYSVVGVASSIATGVVIAAGGLARQPMVWLAVPPLVVLRLTMNVLSHKR